MKFELPRTLSRSGAALLVAASLLLSSCGGGEQITPFAPARLIVVGDEMSVLTDQAPQGRKYSINAMTADGLSLDCVTYPIWTQTLARYYGFAFAECNPSSLPVTAATTYAKPGAVAADFATQMSQAEASGPFSDKDLVTVLLGANDVLELYRTRYVADPSTDTYNAIIAELTARGQRLGEQIAVYFGQGPKFIVSTIPRMGQTPYGQQQNIDSGDPQRATVLNDFSNAFNTALRVTIPNDGRYWGLIELDALINASLNNPGGYGLSNVTTAVCTVALPDCTANTLVAGAAPLTSLWASALWIGPALHTYLGSFAQGRAAGNPF